MVTQICFAASCDRDNLPSDALVVDVSSRGPEPFHALSPFQPHGGIPVPGMPGMTSDSVEGIWQGLKVFKGRIANEYFVGRGRKRGGRPEGHRLGDGLLGLVAARREIYCPSYCWMLEHRAPHAVVQGFLDRAVLDIPQYVHDLGNNGSLEDIDSPLAHATVLAAWLNERLADRRIRTPTVILAEAATTLSEPSALLLLAVGMKKTVERLALWPGVSAGLGGVLRAACMVCSARIVGQETRAQKAQGRLKAALSTLVSAADDPAAPAVLVGRAMLGLVDAGRRAGPPNGSLEPLAVARRLLQQAAAADGRFTQLLPPGWTPTRAYT